MRVRTRARFRWQGRTIAALTVVWVLLWGHLDLTVVLSGVLVGYLVSVVFPMPAVLFSGRLRPLGCLRMVAWLLRELVVASFRLAAYSFRRDVAMRPGIVRVDLLTSSDIVHVLTAALVSLVPGTLVVEAPRRERRLYLHVFDLDGGHGAEAERRHAMKAELMALSAIGSDAELARARARQQELRQEEGS